MNIEMKPTVQIWCDESDVAFYLRNMKSMKGRYILVNAEEAVKYNIDEGHYTVRSINGYIVSDDGLPPRLVEVVLEQSSAECVRCCAFEPFKKLAKLATREMPRGGPWSEIADPDDCLEGGEFRSWMDDDHFIEQLFDEGLLPAAVEP